MTEYLKPGPFTVPAPGTEAYRRGHERTFGPRLCPHADPAAGRCKGGAGADRMCLPAAQAFANGRCSFPDEPADDMASLDGAPGDESDPRAREADEPA